MKRRFRRKSTCTFRWSSGHFTPYCRWLGEPTDTSPVEIAQLRYHFLNKVTEQYAETIGISLLVSSQRPSPSLYWNASLHGAIHTLGPTREASAPASTRLIVRNVDNFQCPVASFFINFRCAFDSVDREELCSDGVPSKLDSLRNYCRNKSGCSSLCQIVLFIRTEVWSTTIMLQCYPSLLSIGLCDIQRTVIKVPRFLLTYYRPQIFGQHGARRGHHFKGSVNGLTKTHLVDPNPIVWLVLHEPVYWLKFTYFSPCHRLATPVHFPTTICLEEQHATKQSFCGHAQNMTWFIFTNVWNWWAPIKPFVFKRTFHPIYDNPVRCKCLNNEIHLLRPTPVQEQGIEPI